MTRIRAGGEPVRKFIVRNLPDHPNDIVRLAAAEFSCSRQAIHKHLRRLVTDGAVVESGTTRNKRYELAKQVEWEKAYHLASRISEDEVWRADISPQLGGLPENVLAIWQYGFTEMFNNVVDHSGASAVVLNVERTAATTTITIYDDGVGIFKKIQAAMGLADARHAVLELAKGKFTTDPANHSGEGIFFSSRMFDEFAISSGDVYFSHHFDGDADWILQADSQARGTLVRMSINNHTARTVKKVFDKFSSDDDFSFSKTIVPVKLMKYGDDNLISRSQAKRLLSRFERFRVVILDFSGVASIGQAFADEVFRVFPSKHPGVQIKAVRASSEVKRMVSRARALTENNTNASPPTETMN